MINEFEVFLLQYKLHCNDFDKNVVMIGRGTTQCVAWFTF